MTHLDMGDGNIVTIDNTRVAVARELGIKQIPVRVHQPTKLLPKSMRGRFGEALKHRSAGQNPPLPVTGTSKSPKMPKSE